MKKIAIAVALVAVALTGCGTLNNEQQGSLIGATAGGIIGAQVGGGTGQVIATFVGAIIGSQVGANLGRSLDQNDRARIGQALEYSPSGRATEWVNPDRGTRYRVIPEPAYRPRSFETCRRYTMVGYINGRPQEIVGTACRQSDGTWKSVN